MTMTGWQRNVEQKMQLGTTDGGGGDYSSRFSPVFSAQISNSVPVVSSTACYRYGFSQSLLLLGLLQSDLVD